MIYQLPNGKIVNISIEVFLRMTDEDFRYVNESGMGSTVDDSKIFDVSEEDTESLQFVDENIEEIPDELDFSDNIDLED